MIECPRIDLTTVQIYLNGQEITKQTKLDSQKWKHQQNDTLGCIRNDWVIIQIFNDNEE